MRRGMIGKRGFPVQQFLLHGGHDLRILRGAVGLLCPVLIDIVQLGLIQRLVE